MAGLHRWNEPAALTFKVAVDDRQFVSVPVPETPETEIRRRDATRQVRQRLHQQTFRERVLAAYQQHCPRTIRKGYPIKEQRTTSISCRPIYLTVTR